MLRRLLLALLTLCLALPAALPVGAAMPQPQPIDMSMAMAMPMEHHQHHQPADRSDHDQGQHAGKHECIGCAAQIDRAPLPAASPQLRGPLTRPALAAALPETRAGPEVPPPRR